MQHSENIAELTAALAQAQGEFKPVKKSGNNPFFKSEYATLDDVIAAVREPLSKHGLSFVQPLTGTDEGFHLETVILHSSGQWLSCSTPIPDTGDQRGTNTLQAFGISLTYMRRYMLTAMLGINAETDVDGNGSAKQPTKKTQTPEQHWIEDEQTRKRFWAWAGQTKGLSNDDVHAALGVTSLKQYTGGKGDAMAAIDEWIAKQDALAEMVDEVWPAELEQEPA